MAKTMEELERPHWRGHAELKRCQRDGTYWQAADGLVVRVAAAESAREAEAAQRALLRLAVGNTEAEAQ